jgi:transcriptional regulator with XRE-family HTH domain
MGDSKAPAVVFGEVLRELRLAKGLTQDQLAEAADTERSHISSIERAERGPSLPTILALAAALQIEAGDLVSRVEKRLRAKRR